MPTLGEFIARAKHYGYTRHTIRIPALGARIVYLRRGEGDTVKLVDLPAVVLSLCETTGIRAEDFGLHAD